MRYSGKTGDAAAAATGCLVIARRRAAEMGAALGIDGPLSLALGTARNESGAAVLVAREGKPSRVLVVGKDQARPVDEKTFRKDMAAAAKALARLDVPDATLCLDHFDVAKRDLYWKARAAFTAISHAAYRFNVHKSKRPKAGKLRRVAALGADRAQAGAAARDAQALDAGLAFAKDLGNQPPNVCDPAFVADAAMGLAGERVTVEVLEEERMAELGMGAFLSVSQGSEKPAKMPIVRYQGGEAGGRRSAAPIALIGKGITFDTGGINLKPGAGMGEMKFDMCGAASVLGAAKAAIAARLPVNLVAIAAAAENMPSGRASRPSDIVKTMSGQTVEILNTDAEGRLVLCDALTYAARFKPRAVVDVATLTGAQVVALGSQASALYANDDDLARALLAAGEAVHDRLWRMPLWDEYQEQLKSSFADMKNIGGKEAGSVTAACFLSRFAKKLRWAHLDIAGPAYEADKGATGRPVPALFEYLRGQAA